MFDKPAKVVVVPLPPDPINPRQKARVTCHYYAHFMVKEVDLGEKGADQLSIAPAGSKCARAKVAGENVVKSDDWSGYFAGVKGDYIVFDGDDGWEGGMSFAIFTPKARKLVNDARMTWMAAAVKGDQVVFVYRRVYRANCSLFSSGDRCWRAIESEIGLLVLEQMPGCRASYVAEQKRVPKFAKQTADDQTVVEYDAALWIDRKGPSIGPIASTKVTCRPAE